MDTIKLNRAYSCFRKSDDAPDVGTKYPLEAARGRIPAFWTEARA